MILVRATSCMGSVHVAPQTYRSRKGVPVNRTHSWSTRSLAVCIVLWCTGCVFNRAGQRTDQATLDKISTLSTAIEVFRAVEGHAPETLDAICTSPRACAHLPPAPAVDAWSLPLRYTRDGSDYILQSAGADQRFDTADDLVFSTARNRETLGLLEGCYAVSFPWWQEFP